MSRSLTILIIITLATCAQNRTTNRCQTSVTRMAMCIALRYAVGMVQFVTRVGDELADAVDELVEAGVVSSRSEAVRLGLEQFVDRCRRNEIGARIARGYRAHPQRDDEIAWADEATVRMIAEEPW